MSKFAPVEEGVNKLITGIVTKFDITGEGTILSAGSSSSLPPPAPSSAPSTPAGHSQHSGQAVDDHARRAKAPGYAPKEAPHREANALLCSGNLATCCECMN